MPTGYEHVLVDTDGGELVSMPCGNVRGLCCVVGSVRRSKLRRAGTAGALT
jgi:hypothetical protein